MYKGVIFDMDGLLINSEPLWHIGEKEVFSSYGLEIDPLMTTGLKINELVEYWYVRKKWDLNRAPKEKIEEEILNKMSQLFLEKLESMPGVNYIVDFFVTKGYKIAINSASHYVLINSTIGKLGIGSSIDIIHSGEDEDFGKPHPSSYLNTCKKMQLKPNECIAFEDSITGVIAVKSAKITCICIPDKNDYANPKFSIADIKLCSLNDFNQSVLDSLKQ